MAESPYMLVLSTCPDHSTAEQIATLLVEQRLAACVNLVPGLTSVYRWQGKTEKETEVLMVIKTDNTRYSELEATLQRLHPYELPEIIAVTLDNGSAEYLRWITTSLENTQ